jgi:hypothetical protein
MSSFYKIIIIFSIISLILPNFTFAQENQTLKAPESTAELRELGKKFLELFPKAIKGAWQAAVEIWQEMWNFVKKAWNSYIFPWLQNIWGKIWNFFETSIFERFKKLIF